MTCRTTTTGSAAGIGQPTDHSTDAIRARYDTATAELSGLCDGSRRWTMRIPAEPARDSDLVLSDALEDIPRLLARVEAVRALHRPLRIFGDCDHHHDREDIGHDGVQLIPEVGIVCEAGYQYTICRECCTDGEFQRIDCADDHPHDTAPCWPCRTAVALDSQNGTDQ